MNIKKTFLFISVFSLIVFGQQLQKINGIYLPVRGDLNDIKFMVSSNLPEVDTSVAREAINFILKMKGDSLLSSPDDSLIFSLAEKYQKKAKPFISKFKTIKQDGTESRMLFNTAGFYGIKKGMRATLEMLALTLYHELLHEVEWAELIEKGMTEDSLRIAYDKEQWKYETRQYAAELRFFYALSKSEKIPLIMTRDEVAVCLKNLELWQVFKDGEFENWYKKNQKDGWVVPGGNIKKVE